MAVILAIAAAFVTIDYATYPPPLPDHAAARGAYHPSEAWLYDRHGVLIDSSRVDFEKRRLAWTPLDEIAPAVRENIIAAEDHRFAQHGGVDWLALAGALRARLSGQPSRGASTITMQLAGFLDPELAPPGARSWRDKLRQMRAARRLESRWTKQQILEAYLNLAPFRGEAQGVGAAALGLFGKTPAALSREDAILLAALLPDPQASPARVAARACRRSHASDCRRLEAGAASMLGPARSLALDPGLAPHLSERLLRTAGAHVRTTLDARIQRLAVAALRRQLQGLGGTRARDGAVLVVDNSSGDVLAYVGGVGGASTAPAVDGANSYRQAGSTLKPFLYAQAIERGYLTPASMLDDSPIQLDTASGLYVPQNYNRGFNGPVSARTALAGSLNIPAIRTLLLVGTDPFRDRLWDTGYRGLTEDGQYYGFSLALGSAEVTLLEQAAAYRSLALGGRWSPLRLLATDVRPASRPVTSPAAAWLVADMMADPTARAATFGLDSALRLPFWAAVKTGTSKAMRDNWCIGFSDRFTVAVWVGNLEGDPMRAVSGTSGAAPVWRDLMLALHAGAPGRAPPVPAGIEARQVAFANHVEQPRREYFLAGTGQRLIAAAPAVARRPRIVSPVPGTVFAIDPDIPPARQRFAVAVAGDLTATRLRLDERDLGPADARPLIAAAPGLHRLRLVDAAGTILDDVRFTIR
ncbi:penicillin-binding protein 1C [Sphingomonas sp. IC4-52]|uniref:penicillin-binding protein 1C n=1 Tax=Sphingomonas sp. IC4-52 TaxID=2887202 RepID=UPI001D120C61|nr:penicillin-binding protein 1C [Sphingomonas sp. IC4-52]MCC2981001.1 penicillin-binding protein 1C [Sphingomonas sp. IC4-52]